MCIHTLIKLKKSQTSNNFNFTTCVFVITAPAPTPTDFVIEDITDRTITFTWKDGEGLERDKLHGYVIQRLGEREEKWVTCNRVPIRGNRAWVRYHIQ